MKRAIFFLLFLAGLSSVSGFLLSKASWIGRVGITFFFQEYNFMKIWWQGAIAVYLALIILFTVHYYFHSKWGRIASVLLNLLLLGAAAGGAYVTYLDFTNDFSHHLLGWRFHTGVYLFWVAWAMICLFFMFKKKEVVVDLNEIPNPGYDETETTNNAVVEPPLPPRPARPKVNEVRNPGYDEPATAQDSTDQEDD